MAASRGAVPEEKSSSEDEDQEKLREAAWSFGPPSTNGTQQSNSAGGDGIHGNGKQSRRVSVSRHDHDGNELQTTPEFRAHVAKKLVAMLDSCISESTSPETIDTSTVLPARGKDDEEDVEEEGFRLFSTSVPGLSTEQPSPPARRRPIPSSSDSDSEMEMRLREAAVSVTDLLPQHLLPSMPQSLASPAPPSAEKKKKKKKKKNRESEGRPSGVEGEKENGSLETKKKKKRKLTKGGDQESEMETNNGDFVHSKEKMAEQGGTEEESFPPIDSAQQPEETTLKKKKKRKSTGEEWATQTSEVREWGTRVTSLTKR
ncbi:hypothetical protein SKAU_G00002340 [Synaphobranchus kaupii]|uniref:Protein CUSTOS n=1 Tax=Synaphobranchus kaupii TaxID=118154 RepID=A0A9Q1G8F8_SYNKA|nr:hypothetical protein SKAU_G00002340 [Synaphobranchus kaupii]